MNSTIRLLAAVLLSFAIHGGLLLGGGWFSSVEESVSSAALDLTEVKLLAVLPAKPKPITARQRKRPGPRVEPKPACAADCEQARTEEAIPPVTETISPAEEPTKAGDMKPTPDSVNEEGEVADLVEEGEPQDGVSEKESNAALAAQRCWESIGSELQRRAREDLPRSLRRRSVRGKVVVIFRLGANGEADAIRFESRDGPALVEKAVRHLLAVSFGRTCVGEGRWAVTIAPPGS